jgi:hypothetical protein
MSVDLAAVLAEHRSNVGFLESPNNTNPWGPEQGIHNASYCDSASSIVPYHHGYRWWPESQCGEKGSAYCPFHVSVGSSHGEVRFDHSGQGDPADVKAGDLLFYDWDHSGVADHVETAYEDCPSGGRTHNIGYNTGSPEGCYLLWRDRTYLLCRLRPSQYRTETPVPFPAVSYEEGPMAIAVFPKDPTRTDGVDLGADGKLYHWARNNMAADIIHPEEWPLAGPAAPLARILWCQWKPDSSGMWCAVVDTGGQAWISLMTGGDGSFSPFTQLTGVPLKV